MKNNIKRASVKFREDLLYFQHFMLIFVYISDYHHLNKKRGMNFSCQRFVSTYLHTYTYISTVNVSCFIMDYYS